MVRSGPCHMFQSGSEGKASKHKGTEYLNLVNDPRVGQCVGRNFRYFCVSSGITAHHTYYFIVPNKELFRSTIKRQSLDLLYSLRVLQYDAPWVCRVIFPRVRMVTPLLAISPDLGSRETFIDDALVTLLAGQQTQ